MLSVSGYLLAMLASITALVQFVEAGSRVWQPRVTKYDFAEMPDSLGDGINRRDAANLSEALPASRHLSKRYLIDKASNARLWPDNTIRYCFDDQNFRTSIFRDFKDAVERWFNSGLSRNEFKFEEVSDSVCQNERSTVLLISQNPAGAGSGATVGYFEATKDIPGPFMNLDTSDDSWGTLEEKIGSYAHELGHAWGLMHEQQNPNFWRDGEAIQNTNGGSLFSTANFDCKAIQGYDSAVESCNEKLGQLGVAQLCTSQLIAKLCLFGASEWLPYRAGDVLSHGGADKDKVDWDSIMLYGSYVGTADGKPILTKPDGSDIVMKTVPSELDVQGIQKLYRAGPQTDEGLLNQNSSPRSNSFRSVYSESNGSDSC